MSNPVCPRCGLEKNVEGYCSGLPRREGDMETGFCPGLSMHENRFMSQLDQLAADAKDLGDEGKSSLNRDYWKLISRKLMGLYDEVDRVLSPRTDG